MVSRSLSLPKGAVEQFQRGARGVRGEDSFKKIYITEW
jgi:hypothetical protein